MSSTNRNMERKPNEFYPTPKWCASMLARELHTEKAQKLVWGEPCCGTDNIIDGMAEEIDFEKEWEWAELSQGRDYLTDGMTGPVDAIATNPPFSLMVPFMERSLSEAYFVAYFLRLTALGSRERSPFWIANPPTHTFVSAKRPAFVNNKTDSIEYAWFVWDKLGLCERKHGLYVIDVRNHGIT